MYGGEVVPVGPMLSLYAYTHTHTHTHTHTIHIHTLMCVYMYMSAGIDGTSQGRAQTVSGNKDPPGSSNGEDKAKRC